MAITQVNAGSVSLAGIANYTISGSIDATGSNFLFIGLTWQYGGNAFAGITYNGLALTQITQQTNADGFGSATFYLANPPTGIHDLVLFGGPTITSDYDNGPVALSWATLAGVNTASPLGAQAISLDNNNVDPTAVLTGVAGTTSYILFWEGAFYGVTNDPVTGAYPATELTYLLDNTLGCETRIMAGFAANAGTNTCTFHSMGGGHEDVIALEVLPAPAGQTITAAPLPLSVAVGAATVAATNAQAITGSGVGAAFSLAAATVSIGSTPPPTPTGPLTMVYSGASSLAGTGPYTETINANGATLLIVGLSWVTGSAPAVTFGGQAMTIVPGSTNINTSDNAGMAIYSLVNPPTGAQVLSVASGQEVNAGVVGFTNEGTPYIGDVRLAGGTTTGGGTLAFNAAATTSYLIAFEGCFFSGSQQQSITAGWNTLATTTSQGDLRMYGQASPVVGSNPFAFMAFAGDYVTMTGVEILGTASAKTITVNPLSATFSLPANTVQYDQTVSINNAVVATYAPGAVTVAIANPKVITIANDINSIFSLGPVLVAVAHPPVIIANNPVTMTVVLGGGTVAQDKDITAVGPNAAFALGDFSVTVPPVQNIVGVTPGTRFRLGAVLVSQPVSLVIAPLTLQAVTGPANIVQGYTINARALPLAVAAGAFSIAAAPAPAVTVAPLPLAFASGPATVAASAPPAVTVAPQTATFSLGPVTVSVPPPQSIVAAPSTAAFVLPSDIATAYTQNLRILAMPLTMRFYNEPLTVSNYVSTAQAHDTGVFTITLTSPALEQVVVNWFTANDSAIAGIDYTAASGQAIIPVGQTSTNITVKFAEPQPGAPAKDFIVYLSSPTNAILGKNFGYCNIPAGTPVVVTAPTLPALSISPGVISQSSIVVPPTVSNITAAPLALTFAQGAATISQAGVTPPVVTALTPVTAVGSKLFDQAGVQYIPRTCHWYGFESNGVPGGLWARAYKSFTDSSGTFHLGLLDQVKNMGFNGIRLAFNQNITWGKTTMDPTSWSVSTGMTPNDSYYTSGYVSPTLNPDLFRSGGTSSSPQSDLITCLEIMDKIVAYCATLGLRIILDMHTLSWNNSDQLGNSRATSPTSSGQLDYSTANPLSEPNWIYTKRWYTTTNPGDAGMNGNVVNEYRNEAQAIAAWVALAARYEGQPAVMGCDLINEPAGTTWDDDAHTGLPAYFERCGAAIMAVNSDLMIVCEAPAGNIDLGPMTVETAGFTTDYIIGCQFSGNFSGVRTRPVVLKKNGVVVTGKVMYSPHHYGSYAVGGDAYSFLTAGQKSLWNNPVDKIFGNAYDYDENFPENLPGILRQIWGFIAEDNIAPVWIGEMGGSFAPVQLETTIPIEQFPNYTTYNAQNDIAWITMLDRYMRAYDIGHNWFSLNAEPSGAAYGILGTDSSGAFTTDINSFQKPYVDMCLSPTPLNPPLLRRLKVNGNNIIDDRGNVVKLKSQNWWGMELQLVPEMLAQNGFNAPGRAFRTITYTGPTSTNESSNPAVVAGTSDTPLYTNGQVFEGVIAQLKREGYNCIRVPLCEDVTWNFAKPYPGTNINGILNPQLCSDGGAAGLYDINMRPAIEILDQIVAECHRQGVYIFVDLHSVAPENPYQGNDIHADGGLWYTTSSPTATGTGVTQTAANIGTYDDPRNEAQAIAFHEFIAARYSSRWPCFAGIDLINEPSLGTWDLNPTTGLVGYYNRAIAAIRSAEPDWNCLVICEGTSGPIILNGTDYEYPALAGNLSGVATLQVTDPANKVVYSIHEYQTFNTPRFLSTSFPSTLPPYWDAAWGFILQQNIAPVIIGEFGADLRDPTRLSTTDTSGGNGSPSAQASKGRLWMNALSTYANANGASWSYWAIVVFNPPDYSVGYGNLSGPWIGYDQTTDDPDTKPYLAPFLAG